MTANHSLRRASRRFEFAIHEAVPESPQPMYQEHTYGKTSPRFTGQASDVVGSNPDGEVAAVFVLRDEEIVALSPDDARVALGRPGQAQRKPRQRHKARK